MTRLPYALAKMATGLGLLAAFAHGTVKLPPALAGALELVTALLIVMQGASESSEPAARVVAPKRQKQA